jgi:hypothetical protein
MNHKNDPQDALQAVYQGAVATGPPVFHQIAPYLSPAYQAQQKQAAQTRGTIAQTGALTAQNQQTVEQATADRNRILGIPEEQRTQEDKQKLTTAESILTPQAKASADVYKEYIAPDGKTRNWFPVNKPEMIPQGWSAAPVGAGANRAPKLGWTKVNGKWGSQLYDPETNQPVPDSFDSSKVPPSSILSMFPTEHTTTGKFVDSNGVLQTYSSTNTSRHEIPSGVGDSGGSGARHPANTSPTNAPPSGGSGTHPIGYEGSPEYKQLVKKTTDANAAAKTIDGEYKAALKQAATLVKDPSNGPAAVGLSASYLKNVIGGHNTGVRINQAEWKAAVESRPFLAGIEAHWGPDGYMTGVVLTPKQAVQMANEIKNKRDQAHTTWQQLQDAADAQKKADMDAGGLGDNPAPKTPKHSPETHVFDSKAWLAANPGGDVEAAKAAAKKKGYEVQ